ncbi:MAG TPA: alternative ribosome rescue aminoacyl-tRNA hydrolase ArfB [Myxococcota bacterium]
MPITVNEQITIPDDDYEVSFSRSGGAGGQNVNKVSSKVLLRFHLRQCAVLNYGVKTRLRAAAPGRLTDDGDLLITSDRERDQKQNLDDAEGKLVALILSVLVPPRPRTATKPTKGSQRRRLNDKSVRGSVKQNRGKVRHDD